MKYFKLSEFDSPDAPGSGRLMDKHFLQKLDKLRGEHGKPFVINSGIRTPEHNRKVGGAPKSAHLLGKAVDISTAGWSKHERMSLMLLARKNGFTGVGVASTYIHLDTLPRYASWRYTPEGTKRVEIGRETAYA